MPRVRAVLAVLVAVLLSACAPPVPSPTPSVSPSFACTPEAGGDPSPCSQASFDAMQAKDALYAQAEAVYRRYIAEQLRMSREGGSGELSPELAATTMGLFRKGVLSAVQSLKDAGYTVVGGDFVVRWVRRLPGLQQFESVVVLAACADGSSSDTYKDGVFLQHNAALKGEYYFALDEGELKIAGSHDSVVSTCDS